jgi:iron complex transport system substrate-binding protein
MQSYFKKYQIEDLGQDHLSINLEKLVATNPDLILATTVNKKIYDQLEKIAPVIVLDAGSLFDDWQASVREISKIVGEETAAETFINKVLGEAEQGKAEVKALGDVTVSFARAWKKEFTLYSEQQLILFYDKENGLGLSSPLNWPTERSTLSLEAFSEFDPDYIFMSGADQEFMDELSGNSVWNALTAVKNGRVFSIDLSALTGGPLAMQYGVQTVLGALTK